MTSTAPTTPGSEGLEHLGVRKEDAGSMHNLLETLLRGASYLREDQEEEKRQQQTSRGRDEDEEVTPRPRATDEKETDYFVQLHENRAKGANERHDFKTEHQQQMLAHRERLSQTRRRGNEEASQEALTSLHKDALASDSNPELSHDNALEKLHSRKDDTSPDDDDIAHLFMKGDEHDADIINRSASRGSNRSAKKPKKMTKEEELSAIQIEFGPSECVEMTGEEERIIASEPCLLLRKVMINGYAVLTNHRLCFIALLSNDQVTAGLTSSNPPPPLKILRQGPATLHRPGLTQRKRKAWFVLTDKSITAYPGSDELYEPLGGFHLTSINQLSIYKDDHGHSISFRAKNQTCYLEFETQEAASAWQKDIEAAKWKIGHDTDKVRVSIPLVRIRTTRFEDYLSAITLLHVDTLDATLFSSSRYRAHDYLHRHHNQLRETKSIHAISDIVFGLSKANSTIIPQLQFALTKPIEWRSLKAKSEWWSLPEAIVEIGGPQTEGDEEEEAEEAEGGKSLERTIIDVFALECRPDELQLVKADIVRTVPSGGVLALSPRFLCFYRKRRLTGLTDTRIKIPIHDLKKVMLCKAFRWHYYGIRVQVRAHEDLIFELKNEQHRDKAKSLLLDYIDNANEKIMSEKEKRRTASELTSPGQALAAQGLQGTLTLSAAVINEMPRAVNVDLNGGALRVDPIKIICLTIGSRGDVQPYIALCKQLQKHNHECIIVSHDEYRDWVEGHGIGFRAAGGDPGALMKLSVEYTIFSPQFFKEAIGKFKHWLDELLRGIMETCWDADLIIESPSTFGGIHVAEAIGCYYMRAFTMPWTKTSAYPQAFSVPSTDLGPQYNAMSYTLFDQILWTASSGQINRWRKNMLHLASTDQTKMKANTVPFMYNFSPAVVPPPLDWGSLTSVTGYWFMEREKGDKFDAPQDLVDFIAKAKKEGKKLCYIGFGSITLDDPRETQKAIYEAVVKCDVRAIVSKGWSERMVASEEKGGEKVVPLEVPSEVYALDSIPHDWLFPQIDVAMHHGGAGTTGASLKAGLITLIHPFFGDQYFWSARIDKLGAGLRVKNLKVDSIVEALSKARDDRVMREKAEVVGQAIRQEKGVEKAVTFIYTNLSRSKRTKRVRKERLEGGRRLSMSSFTSSGHSHRQETTSDESAAEESPTLHGTAVGERRMSHGSSILSFDGLRKAAYHPMETLHMSGSSNSSKGNGRSRSSERSSSEGWNKTNGVRLPRVESPRRTKDARTIKKGEEGYDDEEDNDDDGSPDINQTRQGSALRGLQNVDYPQNQISLPHLSIYNKLKFGLGDKKDDADVEAGESEKVQRRKEEKEQHLSAKEEDQRRREALLVVWRENERWDLLGESELHEQDDDEEEEKDEGEEEKDEGEEEKDEGEEEKDEGEEEKDEGEEEKDEGEEEKDEGEEEASSARR
ncbi:hypothetical protein CBS101457_005419 [Exobasidium rhododendri]|nr:hypothetical protein CBS101457_005419 [Exobasidium rhododendri]